MPLECSVLAKSSLRSLRSQTLNAPPRSAQARHRPSPRKATLVIPLTSSLASCLHDQISLPVKVSHTLTVVSLLAEARNLPSRLKATLVTSAACPFMFRGNSLPVPASQSFTLPSCPPEATRV